MNTDKVEFTLLSEDQTFGNQWFYEKIGTMCAISDFAILLGAFVPSSYHVEGDNSLKGRLYYAE